MSAQDPVRVVYLGGFGRSGSTLVERVLGSVRGWVNIGELVDLARSVAPRDELCGCGERFSRCGFWTEVGGRAFGGWSADVSARLAHLHRAAARQRHLPLLLREGRRPSVELADLRDAYGRIYRAVADVAGATVVVDASKGPALGLALAGSPAVDLRFLNVVRDPRAVSWSWTRSLVRPHDTSGTDRMWRIPAHRAAVQWSALQAEVAAIERCTRVPVARLRYEDFVDDPGGTLVPVTAALGLPLSSKDLPALHGEMLELGASHGLSGNPSRFSTGAIELRRDDRWVRQMPARDRAAVVALTLPLLVSYGYARGGTDGSRGAAAGLQVRDVAERRSSA